MISCQGFPTSTKLIFGTLLGLMALGTSAQQASANPLQAIPIIGDLLRTDQPLPIPTELNAIRDIGQGNTVNFCVTTCNIPPSGAPRQTSQATQQQAARQQTAQQQAARPNMQIAFPNGAALKLPL